MSPNSSEIPSAKPEVVTTDAEVINKINEDRKAAALAAVNLQLAEFKRRLNRHNTPFDGHVRKKKKAKAKASRKANKKRKMYLKYGV